MSGAALAGMNEKGKYYSGVTAVLP
jgi:hypothetical protein